jgi:hypothetical protein
MKFKIFKEKITSDEVFLKLRYNDESQSIKLVAVDAKGQQHSAGNLLKIKSDGTVYFYLGVSKTLGFQLERHGQILVTKEA